MKAEKFPLRISEEGVSARIRKVSQTKHGQEYIAYVIEYILLGQRKREWRTDLAQAKATAREACRKIANGQQLVLTLKNDDRLEYLRATEALDGTHVKIDAATHTTTRTGST